MFTLVCDSCASAPPYNSVLGALVSVATTGMSGTSIVQSKVKMTFTEL